MIVIILWVWPNSSPLRCVFRYGIVTFIYFFCQALEKRSPYTIYLFDQTHEMIGKHRNVSFLFCLDAAWHKHRNVSVAGEGDLLCLVTKTILCFCDFVCFLFLTKATKALQWFQLSTIATPSASSRYGWPPEKWMCCRLDPGASLHRCHRWQRIRSKSQIFAIFSQSEVCRKGQRKDVLS